MCMAARNITVTAYHAQISAALQVIGLNNFPENEACPRLMWKLEFIERPDEITVHHRF